MWVNTIVFTSPMRPASQAATGKEKADSTPDHRKKNAGLGERQSEPAEEPQRQQRLHREAAGEGVDAEQGGEAIDDALRRAERRVCLARRGRRRRDPRDR